jgi:hypothetical protein
MGQLDGFGGSRPQTFLTEDENSEGGGVNRSTCEYRERPRRKVIRHPDPTPAEIRIACLQIQAGWSADERLRRAGVAAPDELDHRSVLYEVEAVPCI